MGKSTLIEDLVAYFVAIRSDWTALTGTFVGVLGWIFGSLMSMPVAAHWIFLGGGTLAMLVASFVVWRKSRGIVNAQIAYLRLQRIIAEGEKRLAACVAVTPGDTRGALEANAAMSQWYRETLETARSQYQVSADHFADLGHFGANGTGGVREQVSVLLKRLREVAVPAKAPTE